MKTKPKAIGFFVLIELDKVEEKTASGIIQYDRTSHEREQRGAHRGTIIGFGPLAFAGYSGIDSEMDAEGRAAQWGVKVGDEVEMGRYAGDMIKKEGVDRFMLVPDQKLMGVFYE